MNSVRVVRKKESTGEEIVKTKEKDTDWVCEECSDLYDEWSTLTKKEKGRSKKAQRVFQKKKKEKREMQRERKEKTPGDKLSWKQKKTERRKKYRARKKEAAKKAEEARQNQESGTDTEEEQMETN